VKTLTAALTEEKNKLDTTSAWLPLIQVYIPGGSPLYLVPNPSTIVFGGITYQPFGCTIGESTTDSAGGLADLEVVVSNVSRTMSGYLETTDLRGARVVLLIVNSANLADANALAANEEYEITEVNVTEQAVSFRLGHDRLMQQRFPNRRFLRDNCQSTYNIPAGAGLECGYTDTFAGPGTVSSSSTTITGTNTDFAHRFQTGDTIIAATQTRIVNVVTSDTSMTVTVAPSPVWSNASYTVKKPTCDKIMEGDNGCRAHSNQARFGAFPALPFVAGRLAGWS